MYKEHGICLLFGKRKVRAHADRVRSKPRPGAELAEFESEQQAFVALCKKYLTCTHIRVGEPGNEAISFAGLVVKVHEELDPLSPGWENTLRMDEILHHLRNLEMMIHL